MVMSSFNVILAVAGLASVAAGTRAGQIEIDPQWSKLGVAVSSTVDSFAGHLQKYQATVKGIPTEANFDFADLKTGDKARNAAMLKWLVFNSKQTASFRLSMVNFMDFKLPKSAKPWARPSVQN